MSIVRSIIQYPASRTKRPYSVLVTDENGNLPGGVSIKSTIRITSSPYTVLSTDCVLFIDTDNGNITILLPEGFEGKEYRIINTGTSGNDVIVTPDGTENLLGANSNYTLEDGDVLLIHYNVTEGWY